MKKLTFLFTLALLVAGVTGVKADVTYWSDYCDATWGSDYATATNFTINTPAQLAQFAYMVNSGSDFSGKTVTLDDVEEIIEWHEQTYHETIYFNGYLSAHNWVPIGTAAHPFNGTFNGNGKSISYMTITGSDSYQGLFGYIGTGGTVQNLAVGICTISGSTQVGGLAGYNGGTVQNCIVKNMTITGTSFVGAIIGQNAGSVSGCYCYYSMNSQPDLLTKSIGQANSTTGTDIEGASRLYYATKSDGITITHGGTSTGLEIGGAEIYSNGVKEGVFFFKQGATATLTYNYPGYNVTYSVTGEGSSITNSTLTVGTENFSISVATKEAAEWSGTGNSADDPYIIYNREQLDMLANRVNDGSTYQNKFFRLAANISYSEGQDFPYTVIGSAEHPFWGTFDGNGNEIQYGGSESTGSYVGYFGYNKGTIKNLSVSNSNFQGCSFVGIIAGYNEGTIENCRVKGGSAVQIGGSETYQYYGGVAGYNKGIIKTTVCAANVRSGFTIGTTNLVSGYTVSCSGGIAGYNAADATIENCLYLGRELMGSAYVGAIAGQNEGSLTHNLYHNNGYAAGDGSGDVADHIGTYVKGVGTDGSITGNDTDEAMLAKVVKLDDDIALVAEPTTVTTTNPNDKPVSVYANGILFDDSYFGDKMDNAFYTTATTVGLTYTETVPSGYEIVFAVETGANSSISGSTLTISDDVVGVTATLQRVPDANSWLAEAYRAESFYEENENAKTITIASAAELGLLAYNVNFGDKTYEGYTITLGTNIDLAEHTWEPIGYGESGGGSFYPGGLTPSPVNGDPYIIGNGSRRNEQLTPIVNPGNSESYSSASGFLGDFDGAGHIISNMNVDYPQFVGLFSTVASGTTVKNVTISNAQVKGYGYVGAVAGMCSGTIMNCHVLNGDVEFSTEYYRPSGIGGIAGMCEGGSIEGCTVIGTNIKPVVEMARGIGGIVGGISSSYYSSSTATLQDCLFAGNILKVTGNTYVGAIAGMSQGENTITNNYYVNGVNLQATPNTDLKAIGGADIENGAELAYAYDEKPAGMGTKGTQYPNSGLTPYSNGLYYTKYYTPYATATMDITLSNSGDNTTLISDYNGDRGNVTLGDRTLAAGVWNTLCLPFKLTSEQLNDDDCPLKGATLKELCNSSAEDSGFNNGELKLTFVDANEIEAGHAYIVKINGSTAIANPVFNNVTLVNEDPEDQKATSADGTVSFQGSYAPISIPEGGDNTLLYLSSYVEGNETKTGIYYPNGEMTIGAQRAVFHLNGITAGSITNARLFFGDEESDATRLIDNAQLTINNEAGAWYSIDGIRLNKKPTRKGLYIHNNRKVNIK